ncbi:MAG TPA: DUF4465 domain-containing protein [Isosphaeraceae bacterium]|nr:DUF4465 domain-containing protein [Isosphaeraceae bacterium]
MRYLSILLLITSVSRAEILTSTFEDQGLPPDSYRDNFGAVGAFRDGGNTFNNVYDSAYDSWSGWAISTQTDIMTPGYSNQFSAITGAGADGSNTYAVAFTGGPSANPFHPAGSFINVADGTSPVSIDVTNTTYAYLSMKNGDAFAQAFGPGDYLLLDVEGFDGLNGTGNEIGSVDFYLADFLGANAYEVDTWQTLDLSSLSGTRSLVFGLQSSDNDPTYGMNTPAYVAVDNLRTQTEAVPEPSSLALLAMAVLLASARFGRRLAATLSVAVLLITPRSEVRADFDPQAGQTGSLAISASGTSWAEWASSVVSITRGPQDISNPSSPLASFGDPANALGPVDGSGAGLVSLGDGGSITLSFAQPITNGPGDDFAVFENGFLSGPSGSDLAYLELAFVDVSSDGVHFFRFPAVSLTQTLTQVGAFGLLDARNLHDIAGKYAAGYGTGFDLSELANVSPILDINHITEVRITDVVGSINPAYGSRDSLGDLINDPFATPFASGGFDLNGVGVLHAVAVPEPSSFILALCGLTLCGALACFRPASSNRSQDRESVRAVGFPQ